MSPVASPIKGSNTHSYPAFDYPVGIGTGLVAVKSGVIRDMPGVVTRQLFSGLQNGQAWPGAGGGSPNSGNVLVVDHGNGEYTAYLHVSPFHINLLRGKVVKQGEVFAYSGHNGWSTGPHLHFEYWKNGVRVDPNVILNQGGGDMPLTLSQLDKLIKMSVNREPSAQELNNPAYLDNPGLAIDTFWENGGKQGYPPTTPGYKKVGTINGKDIFEKE